MKIIHTPRINYNKATSSTELVAFTAVQILGQKIDPENSDQ